MELAIFGSANGGVVLVAAPFRPPHDAIAQHGPLLPRGHLRVIDVDRAPWPELLAQLDRHRYAPLGVADVDALLGSSAVRISV